MISVKSVTKRFAGVPAVDDVSLQIEPGEFFCLLGPSGCGKTTLLRIIAGFEKPDSGAVALNGEDITHQPPHLRPLNMMFQSYALFPHLSVRANIAFGLKQMRLPSAERDTRVRDLLRLARLEGLEDRRPHQLSGGQKQRVALARALARRPRALLLDEPLAALDKRLREETQFELKQVQRQLGTAFIMVTHDQGEAMAMADRIAVMNAGRLAEIAAPEELFERPATRFAAEFMGGANLLDGIVKAAPGGGMAIDCPALGLAFAAAPGQKLAPGQAVALMLRYDAIRLAPGAQTVSFDAVFEDSVYRGGVSELKARTASGARLIVSRRGAEGLPRPGETLRLYFDPRDARVLTS